MTYGNAYRDTSVIVQPQIGGGARMITILGSIHERTNYDFVVTLAAKQEINLSEGGGVSITDSMGEVDMTIPPPWAYDASGSVVASDYSLEGTTLTLNIHPGSSAVYPIIADPVFTWGWYRNGVLQQVGDPDDLHQHGAVSGLARYYRILVSDSCCTRVVPHYLFLYRWDNRSVYKGEVVWQRIYLRRDPLQLKRRPRWHRNQPHR